MVASSGEGVSNMEHGAEPPPGPEDAMEEDEMDSSDPENWVDSDDEEDESSEDEEEEKTGKNDGKSDGGGAEVDDDSESDEEEDEEEEIPQKMLFVVRRDLQLSAGDLAVAIGRGVCALFEKNLESTSTSVAAEEEGDEGAGGGGSPGLMAISADWVHWDQEGCKKISLEVPSVEALQAVEAAAAAASAADAEGAVGPAGQDKAINGEHSSLLRQGKIKRAFVMASGEPQLLALGPCPETTLDAFTRPLKTLSDPSKTLKQQMAKMDQELAKIEKQCRLKETELAKLQRENQTLIENHVVGRKAWR